MFFGQATDKPQKAVFTKQQNLFLQAKLPFLDPEGTKQIKRGTAVKLLQYARIGGSDIQKIFTNIKLDTGYLTYDQMKKVFRAVSLMQKRHQPSAINIEANISLPPPVFYDQSDEQQQQNRPQMPSHPPPPKQAPIKKETPPQSKPAAKGQQISQSTRHLFDEFAQFAIAPMEYKQRGSLTQTQPNNVQSRRVVSSQEKVDLSKSNNAPLSSKTILQFEKYWKNIPHNSKNQIEGKQVKKLFPNVKNSDFLKKSWAICCRTGKGYLTKGQFFVFHRLTKMQKEPPSQLSSQMKQIINYIDSSQHESQFTKDNIQQNFSDNFDNQFFNMKQSTLPQSKVEKHQISRQNLQNTQPIKQTSFTNITKKNSQQMKVLDLSLKNMSQTKQNNANTMAMLNQIQNEINKNQQTYKLQLKQSQQIKMQQTQIYQKLGNSLSKMQQIINGQHNFIVALLKQLENVNRVNDNLVNQIQAITSLQINATANLAGQYQQLQTQLASNKQRINSVLAHHQQNNSVAPVRQSLNEQSKQQAPQDQQLEQQGSNFIGNMILNVMKKAEQNSKRIQEEQIQNLNQRNAAYQKMQQIKEYERLNQLKRQQEIRQQQLQKQQLRQEELKRQKQLQKLQQIKKQQQLRLQHEYQQQQLRKKQRDQQLRRRNSKQNHQLSYNQQAQSNQHDIENAEERLNLKRKALLISLIGIIPQNELPKYNMYFMGLNQQQLENAQRQVRAYRQRARLSQQQSIRKSNKSEQAVSQQPSIDEFSSKNFAVGENAQSNQFFD